MWDSPVCRQGEIESHCPVWMWAESFLFRSHISPSPDRGWVSVCPLSPHFINCFGSAGFQPVNVIMSGLEESHTESRWWRILARGVSLHCWHQCKPVHVIFRATPSQKRSSVWESWCQGVRCQDAEHTFWQRSRKKRWRTLTNITSV